MVKTLDKINGRTPQTIKKRVGCWNAFRQRKCPAAKDITFKEPGACENCALRVPMYAIEQAMVDILEYVEQLERERDAAVSLLDGECYACLHNEDGEASRTKEVCQCCVYNEDASWGMDLEYNWQWRGVQEVE